MSSSFTIKLNNKQQEANFIQHYVSYEIFNDNAIILHCFILPNCRITMYNSGKILFQGKDAESEMKNWVNSIPKQTKKEIFNEESSLIIPQEYIGCDETGVGDYFASLVAAACFVNNDIIKQIKDLDIKDSKQLNDEYIREIAPNLKKIVPYTIFSLSNEQYNTFINNGYNSHAIKAFVHNKAIGNLIARCSLNPQIDIVMDQFATKKNYMKYLRNITPVYLPTIFETKAENKFLGVACASILARATFLENHGTLNKKYHREIPLGAGKKVDQFSLKFIKDFGVDEFKKNVKWHFANTERILADLK